MRNISFASRIVAVCMAAVALFTFSPLARGQTSAALLVKPWTDKGELVEARGDAVFLNSGHTKDSDDSFRLSEYNTIGRFRLPPGNEISPRVGYDFDFLDLHTRNTRLPNQLTDASIALGTGITKYNNWLVGLTLGVGYAGDNAFGEGTGWYGKADLVIAREINDDDAIGIIIDYDGNRTYLPDVPLPGFGYSHRFDPHLKAVLGVPYTSISWKPIDRLDLELEWQLVSNVRANISYEILHHLNVYGGMDFRQDGYHVSSLPEHRRLLFNQRRVEVGVRYDVADRLVFTAGIGYAFDGQFRSGWDFQHTSRVEHISDEPYAHVGMEVRF